VNTLIVFSQKIILLSVYLENTTIKQADVVLLGFPLMWPMSDEVRRNDLLVYEPLTRPDGPAMTWSMHSIGFIESGDFDKAEQLFRRSYETYVRPPFNVRELILVFFFVLYASYFDTLGMD
jgi:trehalose/maltose hydrolase-like predicted phosphorylase